jgi:hypothetical protein
MSYRFEFELKSKHTTLPPYNPTKSNWFKLFQKKESDFRSLVPGTERNQCQQNATTKHTQREYIEAVVGVNK